jgi:CDP-paratose 2-epimerase
VPRRTWIITGGAGFIGTAAARALAERGVHPVLFDNLSRPSAQVNLERLRSDGITFDFVEGDLTDTGAVDRLLSARRGAEAVLHLAAQVAVTTSIVDPLADFETNAFGTFALLDRFRMLMPDSVFLYASTNKVYGDLRAHALRERTTRYELVDFPEGISEALPVDPASPYGCSKTVGDLYTLDYARTYGLRAFTFRQSCIYGPGQFGVEDQGWVAWLALAAALGEPITIYGDGKQVRDLLHVTDLIELYLLACERGDAYAGRAYNVGGGSRNTLSLLEFISHLQERFGPLNHEFAPARPADQAVFVADTSRARAELGWSSGVDISTGLESLLAWVVANTDVARRLIHGARRPATSTRSTRVS